MNQSRCIKTSLKSIVSDETVIDTIEDHVQKIHRIRMIGSKFVKAFIIYQFDRGKQLPKINDTFYRTAFQIVCDNKSNPGPKNKKPYYKDLKRFYNKVFCKSELGNKVSRTGLSYLLQYAALDMVTAFTNNIQMHFIDHLNNFLKCYIDKMDIPIVVDKKSKLTEKEQRNKAINKLVYATSRHIVDSDNECPDICTNIAKKAKTLVGDNVDITKSLYRNQQILLYPMIRLSRAIVSYDADWKQLQIVPLVSTFVPGYIKLDTTIISHMFNLYQLKLTPDEIWKFIFGKMFINRNKNLVRYKCRKKKIEYIFDHFIATDGIGASVIQVSSDIHNKTKYGKTENTHKKRKPRKKKTDIEFLSFEMLTKDDCTRLIKHLGDINIVGVDPGKRNLVSMNDTDGNKLSYTFKQRQFESGQINAKQIRNKLLRQSNAIRVCLKTLSNTNKKGPILSEFMKRVLTESIVRDRLLDYYKNKLFRLLRWKVYIKTQQSEIKLVNTIKDIYGPNVLLAYGDWSQTQQMKNFCSTKGIGLKRMLKKYFNIIDVNEYKTSKLCPVCKSETERMVKTQMERRDGKKERVTKTVTGLLCCKNVNCGKIWNRDVAGSINIREKGEHWLKYQKYPTAFKKTYTVSTNTVTHITKHEPKMSYKTIKHKMTKYMNIIRKKNQSNHIKKVVQFSTNQL